MAPAWSPLPLPEKGSSPLIMEATMLQDGVLRSARPWWPAPQRLCCRHAPSASPVTSPTRSLRPSKSVTWGMAASIFTSRSRTWSPAAPVPLWDYQRDSDRLVFRYRITPFASPDLLANLILQPLFGLQARSLRL